SEDFMDSECVSCGACVQACPTATLLEKSIIAVGQPEHRITTTCAYCGVGCSLNAEMQGTQLINITPNKNGHANHGHACVKGRFAWRYATHPDRITTPMIRASIDEPWREVSWDEAINYAAAEFKRIQAEHGRDAVGGITSSRCTNEETYLVQKLVRAAFGNNNVDTCARVCHSPTGYGLKQTLGESAGTPTFDSVQRADTIMIIGANPSAAHPVFASQMKRRLREAAKLIVIDPRETQSAAGAHRRADTAMILGATPSAAHRVCAWQVSRRAREGARLIGSDPRESGSVAGAHYRAGVHLKLLPGTNVAIINALAHVIVTENLLDAE